MGLMSAATIYDVKYEEYDWLTELNLFAWGFQDGWINTQSYQMLGTQFETQSDPFILFNFIQGVSTFVFLLIEGFVYK